MPTMIKHQSPAAPPMRPRVTRWVHMTHRHCQRATDISGNLTHAYRFGQLRVLSSRIEALYRGELCWQNHVSLSVAKDPRRPTDAELAMVRRDFDMADGEEDNHQPGRIRNLFLPLHLPRGLVGVCDCKDDEEQVIEPDGYRWSRVKA